MRGPVRISPRFGFDPSTMRSTPRWSDIPFKAPVTPSASHKRDRKSTRLNSSHSQISYAVFCLKKKKKQIDLKKSGLFGVVKRGSVLDNVRHFIERLTPCELAHLKRLWLESKQILAVMLSVMR